MKPRKGRKRDSGAGLEGVDTPFQTSDFECQSNDGGVVQHKGRRLLLGRDEIVDSLVRLSGPLDRTFDPASFFSFSMFDIPFISPLDSVSFELGAGDDDVDEIVRRDDTAHATRSLAPDLAMIAPVTVGSPCHDFFLPAFSEFTDRPNRRALVDHFCNILSHLIVFREDSGNPFQQLVLPLCYKRTACMNAIYALASAHLEYRGIENTEKSVGFHNQAIQGLARLIEQGEAVNRNELLATIMLLVYYEVVSGIQASHR
jgi:hypothetical protein